MGDWGWGGLLSSTPHPLLTPRSTGEGICPPVAVSSGFPVPPPSVNSPLFCLALVGLSGHPVPALESLPSRGLWTPRVLAQAGVGCWAQWVRERPEAAAATHRLPAPQHSGPAETWEGMVRRAKGMAPSGMY